MAAVKLAEALLRRKELNDKIERLKGLRNESLYGVVIERINVNENLDEVQAQFSRVSYEQVDAAYNWHAKQLRLVDAAIQRANWTTDVEVGPEVMADYVEDPALKEAVLPYKRKK